MSRTRAKLTAVLSARGGYSVRKESSLAFRRGRRGRNSEPLPAMTQSRLSSSSAEPSVMCSPPSFNLWTAES
ncbi:hypothetical protein CHARACLAT_022674 [Characodon lateralis]|uniref:Uncharacterized protein n=1 Tax=Characodon lateralis TaxID=208331 RepID=A0ABU7E2N6_9TELE|nr:hypothetical protein [Characodon lateralis]